MVIARPARLSARLKVSPAFSKAAGSRGGAPGRAPQSAELSLVLMKAQEGVQGGTLAGGSPFLFCTCACAPLCWALDAASCCETPHFFCPCQKKRGRRGSRGYRPLPRKKRTRRDAKKKKDRKLAILFSGGGGWIRTTVGIASRFTVCPLWPLGNTPVFASLSVELVDGLEPPTC